MRRTIKQNNNNSNNNSGSGKPKTPPRKTSFQDAPANERQLAGKRHARSHAREMPHRRSSKRARRIRCALRYVQLHSLISFHFVTFRYITKRSLCLVRAHKLLLENSNYLFTNPSGHASPQCSCMTTTFDVLKTSASQLTFEQARLSSISARCVCVCLQILRFAQPETVLLASAAS